MASSVVKPNPNPWPKPQSPSISLLDLAFPSNSISMRSNHTKRAKTKSALHTPTLPGNHPPEPETPEQPQSPRWNLLQRAAAKTLDAVETALVSRQRRHKLPATVDPRVQIAGNFAPVPEHPVTHNLEVTGTIPECINGVYLRNGANPFHQPLSGHHLFDGDGMIHAVMINSVRNSASYACRFTETQRLIQERELGRPVFPKPFGELHGHSGIARMMLFYARGLFGLIDHGRGIGVANAGLVYFNRRLLAMSEDDLPYHVRISTAGDLQTVGRHDFGQQLRSTMIAHPKIDPVSGDFFALSYNVLDKPYLKYFKFSIDGDKTLDLDIHIDTPTMIHDFAITENFVVIPDQQVVFRLHEMIKGGSPVIYDENKKSRFGILSKNAENSNNIIWIECPNTFCFHVWNAWEEEDDEVVVIGSCMTPPDSIFKEYSGESLTSVLSEMRLNLRTGESKRRRIIESPEKINLEAGMVNRSWLGRRTRFAYLAIAEPWPKVSGLAKVDLSSGAVVKYVYGEGRYGGEPFFVARERDSDREDDGYILVFVHDENVCKSELQIIDAITLKMEASVRIPSRVPYGFHGTFITSKELEDQL